MFVFLPSYGDVQSKHTGLSQRNMRSRPSIVHPALNVRSSCTMCHIVQGITDVRATLQKANTPTSLSLWRLDSCADLKTEFVPAATSKTADICGGRQLTRPKELGVKSALQRFSNYVDECDRIESEWTVRSPVTVSTFALVWTSAGWSFLPSLMLGNAGEGSSADGCSELEGGDDDDDRDWLLLLLVSLLKTGDWLLPVLWMGLEVQSSPGCFFWMSGKGPKKNPPKKPRKQKRKLKEAEREREEGREEMRDDRRTESEQSNLDSSVGLWREVQKILNVQAKYSFTESTATLLDIHQYGK